MKIKWGIIGLGSIAATFTEALVKSDSSELVAVASRNVEKSLDFGLKHNVKAKKCYGSYVDLVKDDEIDVVYIAVPHVFHKEISLLCLNHNKAVLCEKPVAMNINEITEVIELARSKKLFYMEAMKTRFLPVIKTVKEKIDSGDIGEVRLIKADFGFNAPFDPKSRLYNKELGGGAFLDVGIYNVSLSTYIYNELPEEIYSNMLMSRTDVDLCGSVCLTYSNGRQANLYSSINLDTICDAIIIGTKGIIRIPMYHKADTAYITIDGKEEVIHIPFNVNSMEYEINEVNQCLKNNLVESSIMSWDDTLRITKLMDEILSSSIT